jgi:hypothetical protein
LIQLINIWFSNCVICGSGDAAWPARSPDSSASDFLLQSYLKTRSSPTTFFRSKTENLRNLQALIESVTWWEISCQGDEWQECLNMGEGHLEDAVFKNCL